MSEVTVRAKIKTMLEAVTGIGKVYGYRRWANDDGDFISLFKDTTSGRILGWMISREKCAAEYLDNAEEEATHGYLLQGYMGLKDADQTEILFNALIELVRAKFRLDFSLGDTAEQAGPVSVDLIETRVFGNVLCHCAELRLPVKELFTN